jgi:radical SAM protein with 4Fe4S-binding SPASM domain
VDPDDWGYFLCKTFDEWRSRDLGKVLVNHFETLASQHMGLGSQLCIYSEFCGKGVAVEHDGGVYACDHYVYPEYRLGNIKDSALDSQVFSRTQVKFGYAKNETLPQYCRQCPYLTDCWGGMSEEPDHPHPHRRTGPELSLPGFQAILRARHSRGRADRRGLAETTDSAPEADVTDGGRRVANLTRTPKLGSTPALGVPGI